MSRSRIISKEILKHNLHYFNSHKKTFSIQHEWEVIRAIAISDQVVVAVTNKTIQAWNIKTDEFLWKYLSPKEINACFGWAVYLREGKVICPYEVGGIILCLDLNTGKLLSTLSDSLLKTESINLVDHCIIAKMADGRVNAWDLSTLELVESYSSLKEVKLISLNLKVTSQYIADIDKQRIKLIDRKNGHFIDIRAPADVISSTIYEHFLVCGLDRTKINCPDIIIIDMKAGELINEYKTMDVFHSPFISYDGKETLNRGYINSVAINEQYAFMAHVCGKVVAVNNMDLTYQVLETFEPHGIHLFLYDNYLFIFADERMHRHSSLVIWSVDPLERMSQLKIKDMRKILWDKNRLLISVEGKLSIYDFQVAPKKTCWPLFQSVSKKAVQDAYEQMGYQTKSIVRK